MHSLKIPDSEGWQAAGSILRTHKY